MPKMARQTPPFYAPINPVELARQRTKARALRQTQWWKRRISAGVCYYCRRAVGARDLTMDHIVPLGRGGKSVRGNVVACCRECNRRKKAMVPVEWQEYLTTLGTVSDD